MANSTGVSIQTTDFNLNTARFIISSSDVGVIAMGSSLDRPGVLTNSVEDAAFLTEILSGVDPKDATSIQEPKLDILNNLIGKINVRTGPRIRRTALFLQQL